MSLKSFFVKIAAIWFWFKEITVQNNVLKWGHIYYKTPMGSEREKLAFRKTVELWARINKKITEAYPDCTPPNILRKYAFEYLYVYSHNVFGVIFRSIFKYGSPTESATEESKLLIEKYDRWKEFMLSIPSSKEEGSALQELRRLKEVVPRMIVGNYSITIE